MEKKTLNIHEFLKQFEKEYEFLYDHNDNVAGAREAVDAFDEFLKLHKDFVGEFVRFRGDFISSDREAAAFMFALESMGGLD
jgi:trehalose-6-phosphate synthase